jgi:O-antigen/teichoic acid export membrane protein
MNRAKDKEQDIHRLVRFVGLNRCIHPLATFCVSIIVARALGPEGRGEYGLLLAAVATLPLVVDFGLAYATRFWCAQGRANAHSLLKTVSLVGLLFGAILAAIVIAGRWLGLPAFLLPAGLGGVGIMALALTIFLATPTRLWAHYLAGYERYAYSTWWVTATVGLQALILLLAWRFAQASLDLATIALAVQAVLLFIVFPFMSGTSLGEVVAAPLLSVSELGRMLRYGVWPYLSSILGAGNAHLVVFLISALAGFYETGLFTAVIGPANLLLLIGAPLGFVLPTRTTRRIGDPSFPHQVAVALRLLLCLTVMVALFAALIAPVAIPWIFGEEFDGAVTPFQVLLVGILLMSLKHVITQYLIGIGHAGWTTAISAIQVIASVVLCVILIPSHGALGAAIAVAVGQLCSTAFGIHVFLRIGDMSLRQLLSFQLGDWVPLIRVLGLARPHGNNSR